MLNLSFLPKYEEKTYIIDGSNVCGIEINARRQPILNNLKLLRNNLKGIGVREENILILCDASLRHAIDDRENYILLIKSGIINETPAGIKADKYILSYCLIHNEALLISNDLMKEYYCFLPDSKWIVERRITFMKIRDEIILIPMLDLSTHPKKQMRQKENLTKATQMRSINKTDKLITTLDVLKIIENAPDGDISNLFKL